MFKLLSIIFIVSCLCFLIFQGWYFLENYSYILEFNTQYTNLEYVNNPDLNFIDKNIIDPNDNIVNTNIKFRCANNDNKWYFLSINGFYSDNSNSISKYWDTYTDCISNFQYNNIIVYNPCLIDKNGTDCVLLNNLLKQ